MQSFINWLYEIVWNPGLVYLCLAVGIFFSLRTRAVQIRGFKEALRLIFQKDKGEAGVSSLQALCMTLAGRVGTGNIAGVATAICFGGPGSIFWMWLVALLGASSAFIESTLGQIYKEKINGEYRGSPAFYFEKGLGSPTFGMIFAIITIASIGFFMPGVQSNSIANAMTNAFDLDPIITACGVITLLSFVIFGGVKRIGKFAAIVVPFMAQAYLVIALVIMGLNIDLIPSMFKLIIDSAFGRDAVFGAMIGSAIQWGVMRGVYSNEAGQGTAVHASSAANVSHPVKQGLVQCFSVFIDTLLVCSCTAFIILITGCYNVVDPTNGTSLVYKGLASMVEVGPAYTQLAVEKMLPGYGAAFVAIALLFFAFTTLIAYFYIVDTSVAYLNRRLKTQWLRPLSAFCLLASAAYGVFKPAVMVWQMGDIGVGIMAWLNIIVIVLLQKPALKALADYEAQRAAGLEPVFHPERLGITNAGYWNGNRAETNLELENEDDPSNIMLRDTKESGNRSFLDDRQLMDQ